MPSTQSDDNGAWWHQSPHPMWFMPRLNVLLNLVNQDQRVTHDHARQGNGSEHRHETKGLLNNNRNNTTPIKPKVQSARQWSHETCYATESSTKVMTTARNGGIPAFTDFDLTADSSTVPPTSSK